MVAFSLSNLYTSGVQLSQTCNNMVEKYSSCFQMVQNLNDLKKNIQVLKWNSILSIAVKCNGYAPLPKVIGIIEGS